MHLLRIHDSVLSTDAFGVFWSILQGNILVFQSRFSEPLEYLPTHPYNRWRWSGAVVIVAGWLWLASCLLCFVTVDVVPRPKWKVRDEGPGALF